LSLPPNPPLDSPEELQPLPPEYVTPAAIIPVENPGWSGWDVLAIIGVTVVAILLSMLAVMFVAQRLSHSRTGLLDLAKVPELVVLSQVLAYVLVFMIMVVIATRHQTQSFGEAIRWNWPTHWGFYLAEGVVLSIALQFIAHFLPIPKNLPMDEFLQTQRQAYMLSIFGVTFAPLLEELFFRGFLYPVLARRLGMSMAVLLTALAFASIHGAQLMYSWGPVLVIFMVGMVLTITRAITKSVAAGLLIHVAYNGTLSFLMFLGTDHFRHLEKLNQ
jgi:membrane protease YdiL (CAAX protease family)